MKKTIFFIFFALTTLRVSGQIALKLNLHAQYESFEYNNIRDTSLTIVKNGYDLSILPSPTISFYRDNGNFQEISLSRILYTVDDDKTTNSYSNGNTLITDGTRETTFTLGFRYDYNFLLTSKENPLLFYLGLSCGLTYYSQFIQPKVFTSFKRTSIITNVAVGVVPRITWQINSKIYMDLNIPFNVYELLYYWQKIHNPGLPLYQQSNGGFESTFLPKIYEVRFGIGFML